ncbi:MAG: imidazole glycerol-phosphate synthase subunit HisF [Clostridia bacterium]|nr:imidazole glycerol-phosphate synthase subunit HisF [Clostridia bacterium]MDN5322067.1 imidazole glycerol-phosphate synthase subunit HisF [Clostridia bacterium]
MLTKRIIPCLDVKDGRVVKGVSFLNLRDAGDPVELASFYDQHGADELVFLDISASVEGRKTMLEIVRKTAETITIPFTVGGGINSTEDIKKVLRSGADKVSLNTAAVLDPYLVNKGAEIFGNQCMVVAIDAKFNGEWGTWQVFTHGGSKPTNLPVIEWAQKVEELGAGEILLTSMDCDGHKEGFDLNLTKEVCRSVSIPVIASGGAGKKEDFWQVFDKTDADAALAASIFHYKETSVPEIKSFLKDKGVPIRWLD